MIKQIVMSILIYFRYQYSVFHAIRFAKRNCAQRFESIF
ncbi:hypothetical protein PM8797T_15406 [Gimesia maris DSM 8797]|nr:hypothetical protein PM8797T_15406 [Gimesia maris DSM 8797]